MIEIVKYFFNFLAFNLVALATLSILGVAQAQSSVTLFGGIDMNYRNVSSGTNKFSGIAQDGIYSSRFGVNGVEDLGGGLKAGFHLEGGLNPDTGTPNGFNFMRKSTLGLSGGFGEVRAGRDYTPVFTLHGIADPFATNGVGALTNLSSSTIIAGAPATYGVNAGTFITAQAASTAAGSKVDAGTVAADPNHTRANNSIAYYSPNFNGFTAAVMYGFGQENTNTAKAQGKLTALNVRYDNGPWAAGLGFSSSKGGDTTIPTDSQTWKTNLLAVSYNFGVAKASFLHRTDKLSLLDESLKTTLLGVSAPMGALTLKASYAVKKLDGDKIGNQWAFGGVYDLSKRTSVYGTYSRLKNELGFGNSVGSAATSDFLGRTSRGYEFGVKHTF